MDVVRGVRPWGAQQTRRRRAGRVCEQRGCETVLSVYNMETICGPCLQALEDEDDLRAWELERRQGVRRCAWCTNVLRAKAPKHTLYCSEACQRLARSAGL